MHAALHSPIGLAMLSGAATAARVDYASFRSWQSWHDLATYSWSVASWRWVQGAIIGGLTVAGITALL